MGYFKNKMIEEQEDPCEYEIWLAMNCPAKPDSSDNSDQPLGKIFK